jgi:hypothetical protein
MNLNAKVAIRSHEHEVVHNAWLEAVSLLVDSVAGVGEIVFRHGACGWNA